MRRQCIFRSGSFCKNRFIVMTIRRNTHNRTRARLYWREHARALNVEIALPKRTRMWCGDSGDNRNGSSSDGGNKATILIVNENPYVFTRVSRAECTLYSACLCRTFLRFVSPCTFYFAGSAVVTQVYRVTKNGVWFNFAISNCFTH